MRYSHSRPRWFRFDGAGNTTHLTKLYQWYGGDFEQKSGDVLSYVADYAPQLKSAIDAGKKPAIKWLDYDWQLNDALRKGDRNTARSLVAKDSTPYGAVARRLLDQGAAVPMLVGTLDWCLGRLLGSEPPKAPPGRRRALDARRQALRGRGAEVYGLLREADRAVRRTGDSPETWLERAVLAAAR